MMGFRFDDLALRALGALDPEAAHKATLRLLKTGLATHYAADASAALQTTVAGLAFANPLGLAAGFDKSAEAPNALLRLGFGFVEVGAVTPLPQAGNARPRVFRLREDGAVINRYGFNNDGLELVAARLRGRRKIGILGVNLGANKHSADRIDDYVQGVVRLSGLVDFYTVNVSSPNTPGLRSLQGKASLSELLARVLAARDGLSPRTPVLLKIAPDLVDADKADIADVVRAMGVDGLVVSNTTSARPPGLRSEFGHEAGGLSGKPLFALSTALLREFRRQLGPGTPLIGVGGVGSPRDAYEKILAGASLVQLYTALVYQGPRLIAAILKELPSLLAADGFLRVSEAVGAEADSR